MRFCETSSLFLYASYCKVKHTGEGHKSGLFDCALENIVVAAKAAFYVIMLVRWTVSL